MREEGPVDAIANHVGHDSEGLVAKQLSEKVRLLCWVMTQPASHEKKAKHVKNTWGRRCNYLIFMSTEAGWLPKCKLMFEQIGMHTLSIKLQLV